MLTDTDRALIQVACTQLMARYSTAVDAVDMDRLTSAFAPTLEWKRPGMASMRTHDDIRAFFAAVQKRRELDTPIGHITRHCMTTISIDVIDADNATGITYALVYRDFKPTGPAPWVMPSEPEVLVEYRDKFVRTPDGWRIAEHDAHHILRSSLLRNPLTPDEMAGLKFGG